MGEGYLPSSEFLIMVINDEVPLTGSGLADHNLKLLIAHMQDQDLSNRDWATMLLAQTQIDTPEVRSALLAASDDEDAVVRGEAVQGLAQRDKALALPLLSRELAREDCAYAVFQAAYDLADASLVVGLQKWVGRGGAPWINSQIADALETCSKDSSSALE